MVLIASWSTLSYGMMGRREEEGSVKNCREREGYVGGAVGFASGL